MCTYGIGLPFDHPIWRTLPPCDCGGSSLPLSDVTSVDPYEPTSVFEVTSHYCLAITTNDGFGTVTGRDGLGTPGGSRTRDGRGLPGMNLSAEELGLLREALDLLR